MIGRERPGQDRPWIGRERAAALFLLGVVAFSPPLLLIFGGGGAASLFGWPPLYLYLFGAWAGLIVLTAAQAERRARRNRRGTGKDAREEP